MKPSNALLNTHPAELIKTALVESLSDASVSRSHAETAIGNLYFDGLLPFYAYRGVLDFFQRGCWRLAIRALWAYRDECPDWSRLVGTIDAISQTRSR